MPKETIEKWTPAPLSDRLDQPWRNTIRYVSFIVKIVWLAIGIVFITLTSIIVLLGILRS